MLLNLYGREKNAGVWSVDTVSNMNMILHRIPDADLRNGTLLAEPRLVEGGEAKKLRIVHLKRSLMNDLLNGRVRITVIDEAIV